jgi:hypothetical protein
MRHQRFPYPIRESPLPIAGSFTLFVEKFIADYDLRTKDRPKIGGVSPVKL